MSEEKRQRLSKSQMRERVAQFKHSGLSQKAYSLQNDIPYEKLCRWIRTCKEQESNPQSFLPVEIVPTQKSEKNEVAKASPNFENIFDGGMKLSVPEDFNEKDLIRLLPILKRC